MRVLWQEQEEEQEQELILMMHLQQLGGTVVGSHVMANEVVVLLGL